MGELTETRRPQGRPGISGLGKTVGNEPWHRRVVAEAEMAGADLDVLGQRGRPVDAGAPGDKAVEAAVHRGGRHRQRAATLLERQGPPFDVLVGVVVEQMPGVALN
jgi:hypothetical protein